MISLCDETPVIELGGGSVALDSHWLQHSLEKAARAAGYPQWWPANDIAQTVLLFLKSRTTEKSFSLEKFTSTVRRALQGIGYGEVAPHFLREGIDLNFSLLEVAESTGRGFEIGFLRGCQEACKRMLASEVPVRLALEDMGPAVKYVLGKTHWGPRCQTFAEDLVAHLRYHLPLCTPHQSLFFSLR
jgi:hypothetical protein